MRHFYNWNDFPVEEVYPNIHRRIVSGSKVMLNKAEAKAGTNVPGHRHAAEMILFVLSGNLTWWVGDDEATREEKRMGPGDIMIVPSKVLHGATIHEDSVFIDAFSPPKLGYLMGYIGPDEDA